MSQRYFRSTEAVYESVRLTLDEAWGLPNSLGTATCLEPAASAPRDAEGLLLLAVKEEFCGFTVAADLLPQLLASGAVQEIDAAAYHAVVNAWP